MTTKDDRLPITLRIPATLHSNLQAAARSASHSMNAEIIARLQASFYPAQDQLIREVLAETVRLLMISQNPKFSELIKNDSAMVKLFESLKGSNLPETSSEESGSVAHPRSKKIKL